MRRRGERRAEWRVLGAVALTVALAVAPATATLGGRVAWAQAEPQGADLAEMSAHLAQELAGSEEAVGFLVVLAEQVDTAEEMQSAGAGRAARAAALYERLTEHAKRSQAELRAWLDAQGVEYRPFYIVNMIEVEGDAALAQALRRWPEVGRLEANPAVAAGLARPASFWTRLAPWATDHAPDETHLTYGLNDTHAPEVWALGYRGEGIVVAGQDTGVEWEHPALRSRYRGVDGATVEHTYNWLDAWNGAALPEECVQDAQVPCDDHGHGTHTMGTVAGVAAGAEEAVGMAPGSEWIGCRNMREGVGTPASYAACFQFFLAPYPQGGDPFEDGRPELAPHIINNSWSCPPNEGCGVDTLAQVVETARQAGQFVVVSAGNSGFAGCSSVHDPIAIYDASFTIGAHDSAGVIAPFSSMGPVDVDGSGRRKPDLTAPGVQVRSAYRGGRYVELSGTSMAAPHVAGAAALLWSAAPELVGNVDLSEQVLIKSAQPAAVEQCGSSGVPNNVYGFGRLDALAAVELAQEAAELRVEVMDCDGTPLAGAQARLLDSQTGYTYTALSGAGGTALLPAVYSLAATDRYTLTVRAGSAEFAAQGMFLARAEQAQRTQQADVCNVPASLTVVVRGEGAALAGAPVALVDRETGNEYAAVTDAAGRALFGSVFAGAYRVHTEAAGWEFEDLLVALAPGESRRVVHDSEEPSDLPQGEEPGRIYLPSIGAPN